MRIRGFAIFVACSLLLSACSAGGGDAGQLSEGQEQSMGNIVAYDISLKEITGSGGQALISPFATEACLYGMSAAEDGSRGLYTVSQEKIWQDRSAYLKLEKRELDIAEGRQQRIIFADAEGNLFAVEEPQEEPYHFYLCRYDADGSRQQEIDLVQVWGAEMSLISTAVADGEGRIYLSRSGGNGVSNDILVLDGDGALLANILMDDGIVRRMAAVDGQVYCVMQSQGTDVLYRVDVEAQTLREEIALTEGRGNIKMMAAGTEVLWISDFEGVREYLPETGEFKTILLWADAGINGGDVEAILAQDESHIGAVAKLGGKQWFFVMEEKDASRQAEMTSERGQDASEQTDKQLVIIQGQEHDSELKRLVALFNLQSDEYQVEIRSYEESRLGAELVSGNGPDLLQVGSSLDFYVEKGMLEDLTPYLEQSEKLSAEDLNSRVLELYTVDGVLAAIPPTFSIATLEGKASELGTEAGWTTEEFLEYVKAHPGVTVYEGGTIGDTQEVLVICTLWAEWQRLINFEERKAYFDSDYFRGIVEFAAEYEEAYPRIEGQYGESAETRLQEGKVLLLNRYIGDVRAYLSLQETFQGDMVLIGFPTEDGTPWHGMSGHDVYAISASSRNKEGAWAFIEFLVARQTGESKKTHWDAFPTLNSALEVKLNELQNTQNPPTDEDLEAIRQLIDGASYRQFSGGVVEEILFEELTACFEGDRSVDDTVEIIQNRVQLYLDEM